MFGITRKLAVVVGGCLLLSACACLPGRCAVDQAELDRCKAYLAAHPKFQDQAASNNLTWLLKDLDAMYGRVVSGETPCDQLTFRLYSSIGCPRAN
jgi:hypothetical protein